MQIFEQGIVKKMIFNGVFLKNRHKKNPRRSGKNVSDEIADDEIVLLMDEKKVANTFLLVTLT